MKRARHTIGLVNTPLQLICFNEWCCDNKIKDGIALIRLTSFRSKLVIEELIASLQINCEIKYFHCYSRGLNYFLRTIYFFVSAIIGIVASRQKVIIGEYQTSRLNMLIVRLFSPKRFILVDDGFATTSYQAADDYPVINLFTFFNYLKPKKEQSIQINSFKHLDSIRKDKKPISFAFIGTDILTINWMGGIDKYFSHLQHAYRESNENLYYFPKKHGHDFSDLNETIKENFPKINIIENLLPIEVYLISRGLYIETLYSHISSAIATMHYLSLCKNFNVIVNDKLHQNPNSLFILNQIEHNLKHINFIHVS